VVSLEPPASAAKVWRPRADAIYGTPELAFNSGAVGKKPPFSGLLKPLPANVQLLTLQRLRPGTLLLRLAHQFAIGEDTVLSAPVQVNIATLFDSTSLIVRDATEVSLTANQNKTTILKGRERALNWYRDAGDDASANLSHPWRAEGALNFRSDPIVTLGPLEIKTFLLDVSANRNK
jgi:hypothetical protein